MDFFFTFLYPIFPLFDKNLAYKRCCYIDRLPLVKSNRFRMEIKNITIKPWIFLLYPLLFVLTCQVFALNHSDFVATESNTECKFFNDQDLNVMAEFYGVSTSSISLYFIHSNESDPSHFNLLSILLENIPKSKSVEKFI